MSDSLPGANTFSTYIDCQEIQKKEEGHYYETHNIHSGG